MSLSGTGVLTASANPSSLSFGNVPVNTSVTQQYVVTIDAGYKVEGIESSTPYTGAFGTCAGFTGPGTCVPSETFTPTSPGIFPSQISFFECPVDGGACITIPVGLSGTGI